MKLKNLTKAMAQAIVAHQNWAYLGKNELGEWVFHMTNAKSEIGWQVFDQRDLDYILEEMER